MMCADGFGRSLWRGFLGSLLCAFLGSSLLQAEPSSLPYYNSADFTPLWLGEGAADEEVKSHRIGSFAFTNQDGETVTREDLLGKIYVSNFFFTICGGICPNMTGNVMRVQRAFENDSNVRFLSHTVLPEHDTVERLKNYADENEIDSRSWFLVTGKKAEIYSLARKSYFAEKGLKKDSAGDFLHSENLILVDGEGYIRGVYNGSVTTDTKRLIADIQTLKYELAKDRS